MTANVRLRTKTRTTGQDMCPHCYSFGCDPMSMSPAFQHKIDERLRRHECPTCGNPVGFCRCRSTMSADRAGRPVVHNNKTLRKARALVESKETAHRTWDRNANSLSAALGETRFLKTAHALYRHEIPELPWNETEAAARACGIDPGIILPGWQPESNENGKDETK